MCIDAYTIAASVVVYHHHLVDVLQYVCISARLAVFFFQAEDGIRDLVRSRGLGDVYKRQIRTRSTTNRQSRAERSSKSIARSATERMVKTQRILSLIHI